jgi:hypothetical protein
MCQWDILDATDLLNPRYEIGYADPAGERTSIAAYRAPETRRNIPAGRKNPPGALQAAAAHVSVKYPAACIETRQPFALMI